MKWLLVVVAFVLGAAITWFLTVKRVTRVVPAEDQVRVVALGASADVEVDDVEDEASAFRWGSHPDVRHPGCCGGVGSRRRGRGCAHVWPNARSRVRLT